MTFRALWRTISAGEWRWLLLVSAAVIIFTTMPVVYGWFNASDDEVFTAMHFVSADDWFVYYSFINQGASGSVLFTDLFAPVAHQPTFRPEWLAVGWLAGLLHMPAWAALHTARILLIPVFFVVAYLLIAYLFTSLIMRRLSLLFLAFSSGLGVTFIHRLVQNPLNASHGEFQWPMDLWVPDINTFFTLHTSPHFIAATILIVLIFLSTLLFVEQPRYVYSIIAGSCALALFIFHPFQVLKIFIILGAFFCCLLWRDKRIVWPNFGHGLIIMLMSAPALLYYWWLFRTDWLTFQRAAQNINPTTPLYLTIVSFGGLLVFGLWGAYLIYRQRKTVAVAWLFVAVWAVTQLVLLYAPVNYQRRLGLGIHIPLVLLTVYAFGYAYERYRAWVKPHLVGLATAALLIFLPSTIFVVAADGMVFSQHRELSYLDRDVYAGLQWLDANVVWSDVVFSESKTGLLIPAYGMATSYVGHPVETPLYNLVKHDPVWFFKDNKSEVLERTFLRQRNIDYIFYGPRERQLGSYDPAIKSYLKLRYNNPSVTIYQVL